MAQIPNDCVNQVILYSKEAKILSHATRKINVVNLESHSFYIAHEISFGLEGDSHRFDVPNLF